MQYQTNWISFGFKKSILFSINDKLNNVLQGNKSKTAAHQQMFDGELNTGDRKFIGSRPVPKTILLSY